MVKYIQLDLKFLEQLKIKHQYNEFPVGHGVAPQNFYEFKDWLTQRIS